MKDLIFENRVQAGRMLAEALKEYRNCNGIVLAIPRGGVPVGYEIARALRLPLDVALSKKIGHPLQPEFAVGAVCLPDILLDTKFSEVPAEYIRTESTRLFEELKKKSEKFRGNREPMNIRGKTVLLVDDGIATGSTIKVLVAALRRQSPAKIVVAVPVSAIDTAMEIEALADDFISLSLPEDFHAIGQYYDDFSQVSDEAVAQLLKKAG